jgi:hypothetical protein
MYPRKIRLMSHFLVFYAVARFECSLASILDTRTEFATRNEYEQWIVEQAALHKFVLTRHNTRSDHHRRFAVNEIPWFAGASDRMTTDLVQAVATTLAGSHHRSDREWSLISMDYLEQTAIERRMPACSSLEYLLSIPMRYRPRQVASRNYTGYTSRQSSLNIGYGHIGHYNPGPENPPGYSPRRTDDPLNEPRIGQPHSTQGYWSQPGAAQHYQLSGIRQPNELIEDSHWATGPASNAPAPEILGLPPSYSAQPNPLHHSRTKPASEDETKRYSEKANKTKISLAAHGFLAVVATWSAIAIAVYFTQPAPMDRF